MKHYDHIIFDFDGTLADSFQLAIQAANHYAPYYGYQKITDDNIHILRNSLPRDLLRSFKVRRRLFPFIVRQGRSYMYKHLEDVELYEGVADMIKQLKKRGKKLYIVSSSMTKFVQKIIQRHGLQDYFIDIRGGGKILGKHRKIRQVLKKYHIPIANAVYIGDEIRDIHACEKLGLDIISVTRGYNQESLLQKHHPDQICRSVKEIDSLV